MVIMNQNSSENHPEKDNEYYKRKYSRLRKTIVEIVHQNAALCEEIARTENKINTVKSERKYLLKKLMQYEKPNLKSLKSVPKKVDHTANANKKPLNKGKKGQSSKGRGERKSAQESSDSKANVIFVNPINVDQNGRPIFPIEIGDLSVYSIGEIIHDRLKYHDPHFIFPVGFCSTRLYSSISASDQQCLYTCKIFDGGACPRFEISPEDSPETAFSSNSLAETYALFQRAINSLNPSSTAVSAAEFFGLSIPSVQNLIQSLPGACKCVHYEWKKIEVVHPGSNEPKFKTGKSRARQSDINIEALEKWARDT